MAKIKNNYDKKLKNIKMKSMNLKKKIANI